MTLIRGLDQLIADLDTRQRQAAPPKNRPLQKYTSVEDTLGMETESQTITVLTPPFRWSPNGSTAADLIWNLTEWK